MRGAGGASARQEWHGLAASLSQGSLYATLDVKAAELVFSGRTLSLPALLPSHLRPAEELAFLSSHPLLQGAQDDKPNTVSSGALASHFCLSSQSAWRSQECVWL